MTNFATVTFRYAGTHAKVFVFDYLRIMRGNTLRHTRLGKINGRYARKGSESLAD